MVENKRMNDGLPANTIIRPIHPDDASGLYKIVSHPTVARTTLHSPSKEFSETQAWMESKVPGRHRLVAERAGAVVGSGSIKQYQNPRLAHAANMGLMVHPEYWGQGIGTALMDALIELADNWLNLKRVELEVFVDNPAAVHLYEKFGFEIEGKKRMAVFGGGRWHDEYQMARLRDLPDRSDRLVNDRGSKSARLQLKAEEILIRPLHQDDASELHELWHQPAVCRTTLGLPSMEYARAASLLENRAEGMHRLVAVVDGRVIGLTAIEQRKNPRQAHIGDLGMMVHPEFWGKGVGARLMAAATDLADNWLNLWRVELEVNTDNNPAIRLYQKSGFIIEGTKRFHAYGDGRCADSHFMARIRERGIDSDT